MIRRFVSTAKQSGLKQSCEQTNYRSPTTFDPAVREVFRSPQSGATYKVITCKKVKKFMMRAAIIQAPFVADTTACNYIVSLIRHSLGFVNPPRRESGSRGVVSLLPTVTTPFSV